MFKKLLPIIFIVLVGLLAIEGCGSKPFACIEVEGNGDSIHVNQPVSLNGYCSSRADQYNWEVNLDSVYFTPRITLRFSAPVEQQIYLLVTNQGKSSGTSQKIMIYP